jgi:hypothetical protein
MKNELPNPDEQPITNDTRIESCYEMQKFIIDKAKTEARGPSPNELKKFWNWREL